MDSHALHAHLILYQTLIEYSDLSRMYHRADSFLIAKPEPLLLYQVYTSDNRMAKMQSPQCARFNLRDVESLGKNVITT